MFRHLVRVRFLLLWILTKSSCSFSPGIPTASLPRQLQSKRSARYSNTRLQTLSNDIDEASNVTEAPLSSNAENSEKKHKFRPLHQNWWPVTTVSALSTTRPNPVELLGKKLVLFQSEAPGEDGAPGSWTCLDDQCSHRFAPLSEGRVVESKGQNGKSSPCLQCAYHGWEFDGQGGCTRAPQADSVKIIRKVTSYPVQEKAGVLFVWADPKTEAMGKEIPLPIFPVLEEMAEERGESYCFMRDLPYGFELLGENLLDLAHLPFSHHGVGGLNRDLGCPLPFKMLSESQKSDDGPLYEASLLDAANTDPSFKAMAAPDTATTNLGFYEPCHVRYTRSRAPGMASSYVALYLCPTAAGKSRVFLFNIFPGNRNPAKPKMSIGQFIKSWTSLAMLKQKFQAAMFKRIFTPVFAHNMSHKIFDGDGIFLHKQGNRMQTRGLTYRDYSTPGQADIMVNKFRRYLDATIQITRQAGENVAANAVMPVFEYTDNIPRSTMLDRYESHTKHCKFCSAELQKKEKQKAVLSAVQTALFGSLGATSTALGSFAVLSMTKNNAPFKVSASLFKVGLSALLAACASLFLTNKAMKTTDAQIQQFKFVDYVHAEKH